MEESETRPHTARIHLLHVDDEPGFAETARAFLEREDERLTVETARSAAAGLERLAERPFDCVVSDYEMPGRDGIEFLAAVREASPDLPFVLFTGKGSEEIASEAISAGVTDYLQKGGGTEQYALLANRVVNAVEAYRSRQGSERRKRRLETLISNLPGFVYRCRNEPDWPMELVEGECEELTGYPAAALESGDVVWGDDLLHPDDVEPMWETVQSALEAGGSFEVTYRIVTREGETRWMWERGRAVTAGDGEPTRLEGFVTDVTEAKGRETELERANALRKTLFDALPVGVLAEDADREVMAVNEWMFDVFELPGTPASAVGADCAAMAEAVSPRFEDPERFVERTEGLVAARRPVDAERWPVVDGRTFERSYRPIELPGGDGHLWVYRDVTERVEREAKLDRLRERTRALMHTGTRAKTAQVATDAADDVIGAPLSGVHVLDESGEALELLTAVDRVDEVFDEPPHYERGGEPGSRAAFAWQVFESGESAVVEDVAADPRVTESTPARSLVVHPLERHGIFLVSSPEPDAFDETDRMLSELLATSLRTALDRVEREAQLRERNERLDEFTRVVSHDLRNPIAVARGHLEIAAEDGAGDDPHVAASRRAVDRMATLVDDLLALARRDEAVTDPRPVALRSLAEESWANVETGEARLVVEADRTVAVDPGRAKQLLENLARNSVEHAGSAPTVRVGALPDGFYVEDDGPGIPLDEREDVFVAGYATDGGTGFGLAIVERIAEAHGWTVAVGESEAGGARFEFTGVGDGSADD
ncbi:response regulator [Salinirubellus salinus]|uniref:histidine kinase n=1 Tax=Salinirubellus salinus TaxID=1364945 RepID=A0A9E7U9I8_9EURY|nr:response regulator [Salinirubellus salinus]UWM53268.1 response regulator [Salinirubellus salinus]